MDYISLLNTHFPNPDCSLAYAAYDISTSPINASVNELIAIRKQRRTWNRKWSGFWSRHLYDLTILIQVWMTNYSIVLHYFYAAIIIGRITGLWCKRSLGQKWPMCQCSARRSIGCAAVDGRLLSMVALDSDIFFSFIASRATNQCEF